MVYYSLSDVLIDLAEFEKIRAACNIGGRAGTRISAANAFRAATGDVKGRVEIGGYSGKVYFRDNKQRKGWISRELVMEEPDDHTNLYTKVANVVFNRNTEALSLETVSYTHLIEEINSVAKRKVISSALAILKKRGRNSKNGKSVIWIFVISMMMSS